MGSRRRQDQAEGKLGGDISTMKISAQPTRSPELGQGWRGGDFHASVSRRRRRVALKKQPTTALSVAGEQFFSPAGAM